jgi:hypothetical protein
VIALIPLLLVAVLACVAIVAILALSDRHANQTSHLLAHMAQQHASWARERWELNTRIQAGPGVATVLPQPAAPDPVELLQTLGMLQPTVPGEEGDLDPDDVDESFLVGTGPEFVSPTSGSEIA